MGEKEGESREEKKGSDAALENNASHLAIKILKRNYSSFLAIHRSNQFLRSSVLPRRKKIRTQASTAFPFSNPRSLEEEEEGASSSE